MEGPFITQVQFAPVAVTQSLPANFTSKKNATHVGTELLQKERSDKYPSTSYRTLHSKDSTGTITFPSLASAIQDSRFKIQEALFIPREIAVQQLQYKVGRRK